ncbi:hypothetical protein [Bacillus kwashiorkori]|uniref:hypothetical protein n=1 Tax=Bacillus kwashiorkori TaxID=1522318 RepID=UPI0007824F3C|nr:hypothetical protein [Bacillus kwashiorkori]
MRKKIVVVLSIFFLLFSGAYLLNSELKRENNLPLTNGDEILPYERLSTNNVNVEERLDRNTLDDTIFFRPREYVKTRRMLIDEENKVERMENEETIIEINEVKGESIVTQFPPVNPQMFMSAASAIDLVIEDMKKISKKIATDKDFATNVMDAAQRSQTNKVIELLKTANIKHIPSATFNPDGIHLTFRSKSQNIDCCRLELILRWN